MVQSSCQMHRQLGLKCSCVRLSQAQWWTHSDLKHDHKITVSLTKYNWKYYSKRKVDFAKCRLEVLNPEYNIECWGLWASTIWFTNQKSNLSVQSSIITSMHITLYKQQILPTIKAISPNSMSGLQIILKKKKKKPEKRRERDLIVHATSIFMVTGTVPLSLSE